MAVKVWSERESGGWTECTEASYLMAMDFGGWTRFPLGAYTHAERDALDQTIGYDRDATGAKVIGRKGGNLLADVDYGAMLRYGVALRPLRGDGSREALKAALSQPGRAIVVTGSYGGLPAGHRLRRWQPSFTGGHAWTVIPQGTGGVLWLDPLAPMGHPGDKATVDEVMACAWTPGIHFAREALAGELVEVPDVDPVRVVPAVVCDLLAGGEIYADPDRRVTLVEQAGAAVGVGLYGLPSTKTIPGGRAALAAVRIDLKSGPREELRVGYVGVDKVTNVRLLGPDASQAALAKRMTDALTHATSIEKALGTATDGLGELRDALQGN